MKQTLNIIGREIGPGRPTYIVAEMSSNHNRDFKEAKRIILAAKEACADAIKLQTYTPDTLTIDCENEYFQVGKGTLWEGKKLYDLYGEAYTPWEWQPKLKQYADEIGIDLFSTPFDITAVDFLEQFDMPAYKIASFENIDLPLLRKIASTGKPVIMSTGMANESELDEAVQALSDGGCEQLALLKCTSAYPASPDSMNLRTIPWLMERYNLPVGLSDHSLDPVVAITAVALGACVIERHITLDRSMWGSDQAASIEPNGFERLVQYIRVVEEAMGDGEKRVYASELPILARLRRVSDAESRVQ